MHKLNRNEFRETTDPEGSKPPSFSARSEHFYGVAVFIDVHKRQLRLKFPVINILINLLHRELRKRSFYDASSRT